MAPNDQDDKQGIIEAAAGSRQLRRVYDFWSRSYDLVAGPFERPGWRAGLKRADIQPHDNVLEIAVGTGEAFLEIVRQIDRTNTVFGVDLSTKMLTRTRQRLEGAGFSNVALCQADARHLPFADETFDVLVNNYMMNLMRLADLPAVLEEFHRVLKPGGRFVLVSASKATADKVTCGERFYGWMPKNWDSYLLGGCRPVVMKPFVERAGFNEVKREFRPSLFLATEIVVAKKAKAGSSAVE